MIRLEPTGTITHTGSECVLGGVPYPDIPTLLWPDGVDEPASDWFRYLIVCRSMMSSTVHQYAKVLRPFLYYCRKLNRRWDTVDDSFLVIWREYLLRVRKAGRNSVRYSLERIFEFYVWAEQNNRIKFHVGIYAPAELPSNLRRKRFPITATVTRRRQKSGDIATRWKCNVLPPSGKRPARHTPTDEEMERLHDVTLNGNPELAERNSLLLSLPEESNLRRFEGLQLRVCDIPEYEDILDMIECDAPHHISIKRKGGALHAILINHDLLIRLRQWIDGSRDSLINTVLSNRPGFVDGGFVMISSRTGHLLHRDSVTAIFNAKFKEAGINNASYHRVRAVYALRCVRHELDKISVGVEVTVHNDIGLSVMTSAATKMGIQPESLKPYLSGLIIRRAGRTPSERTAEVEARTRAAEHRFRVAKRKLEGASGLEKIAQHLDENGPENLPLLLRDLADSMERASGVTDDGE